MRIVAVADIHEGLNFPYRIDTNIGVSERALDIHNNFVRASKYAIKNNADLFVIVGDLFERPHVAPIFRELIRRDVIEPLGRNGIKVWIIAGNHDQPRNFERCSSIEDFRGYPHVEVFRKPAIRRIGEDCYIILPYLHPEQIVGWIEEKIGKEIPSEQAYEVAQRAIAQWLRRRCEECKGNKIMFAHYYIQHHRLRLTESLYSVVLPGEFKLEPHVIPEVNLAVFGHVHLHQKLKTPNSDVVYIGSVERIDWGEKDDTKGFIELKPNGSYKFIELPCREMVKISIDIDEKDNPTSKILEYIPENIEEKLLRLEIKLPEGKRNLIDEREIIRRLDKSFHYEIRWNQKKEEKIGFIEYTMDPIVLFRNFVEFNYSEHGKKNEILKLGIEILNEVLR